jgi:hypothetical protein
MDNWNTNKLPERLPFSKKRLPKRVIASYVASVDCRPSKTSIYHQMLTATDILSITS